jgi:hypothetical protein
MTDFKFKQAQGVFVLLDFGEMYNLNQKKSP